MYRRLYARLVGLYATFLRRRKAEKEGRKEIEPCVCVRARERESVRDRASDIERETGCPCLRTCEPTGRIYEDELICQFKGFSVIALVHVGGYFDATYGRTASHPSGRTEATVQNNVPVITSF